MQRTYLVLTATLLLAACSHGSGRRAKQADGSYQLSCKGPLSDCLKQAEHLCQDEGYSVTAARDVRELLGHESGQSQRAIQKSDATVYCGKAAPPAARPMIELKREQPITPTPKAPEPEPESAPRTCTPGATQACVGRGGCSGGQACASDGRRFEACDCGG